MKPDINIYCDDIIERFQKLKLCDAHISNATQLIIDALNNKNKVIFCGNGGSAADAQHLSAVLMGRYKIDRPPLSAIALSVDTSALTAIGNDYGFDDVFARQLSGIGNAGDVLYAISTSGNSKNIIKAIDVAKTQNIKVIGVTGLNGGDMAGKCDILINVPCVQTNHIQEMHIAVGHMICGFVEAYFAPN